ncbi:MAG TPA: VOC family protein [Byssovorax sp.]|jgi:hypothetical protein
MSIPGEFVWYELLTTDVDAAKAFYSHVVGWKTQPFPESPMPYTMWVGEQGPLGGVMPLPDEAKKMGAPPHWTANVHVADVDKTAARVKELGGKIYVEPTDIPTVGRFAVIADPQGATISIFKPAAEMQSHDPSKAGEFSWRELMTTDNAAALEFYKTLFGWEFKSDFDMGPMGKYLMYGQGERTYGGIMNRPKEVPTSAWVYYVHVDDIEAAVARATAKGGKLMNGPMDVPGGDRVAQLSDPQGAWFALHGPGKKP